MYVIGQHCKHSTLNLNMGMSLLLRGGLMHRLKIPQQDFVLKMHRGLMCKGDVFAGHYGTIFHKYTRRFSNLQHLRFQLFCSWYSLISCCSDVGMHVIGHRLCALRKPAIQLWQNTYLYWRTNSQESENTIGLVLIAKI